MPNLFHYFIQIQSTEHLIGHHSGGRKSARITTPWIFQSIVPGKKIFFRMVYTAIFPQQGRVVGRMNWSFPSYLFVSVFSKRLSVLSLAFVYLLDWRVSRNLDIFILFIFPSFDKFLFSIRCRKTRVKFLVFSYISV